MDPKNTKQVWLSESNSKSSQACSILAWDGLSNHDAPSQETQTKFELFFQINRVSTSSASIALNNHPNSLLGKHIRIATSEASVGSPPRIQALGLAPLSWRSLLLRSLHPLNWLSSPTLPGALAGQSLGKELSGSLISFPCRSTICARLSGSRTRSRQQRISTIWACFVGLKDRKKLPGPQRVEHRLPAILVRQFNYY